MSGSVVLGTPVHNLFPPRVILPQRNDPLTGCEPNRPVLEDNTHTGPHHLLLLYVLLEFLWTRSHFSSHVFIDERIHLQMGQEEATAARRVYEVNQYHLHEERESVLRRELGEIQFEEELSLQTQQQLNHWEQEEAAAVTARMRAAESNYAQAATSRLLMVEEEAIRHHQHLRQNLTQAEHSYRATVQQEARMYSEKLSQELLLPPDCANTNGVFTCCRKATC